MFLTEINFSQYLHYLPVPTIDIRDCNSTKHYAGFITQGEICAGFTDAEKSPCYVSSADIPACFW
jgi:hypothetical protein